MASRGNPFFREYSTGYSSGSSVPRNSIPEEEEREYLYPVRNKIVNDLRRHTRAYLKKIGGLPIIPEFPKREYKRRYCPLIEDSMLVGDWQELVETALQEVELPLSQEGLETPYISPIHTPVGSLALSNSTYGSS